MYQYVNFTSFCDIFSALGRRDAFTYEAKRCLFDWLEQWEEDSGEPMELDVIALCCDFNESSWEEIANDYRIPGLSVLDEEEAIDEVRAYLQDHTCIVGEPSDGVFVYQVF